MSPPFPQYGGFSPLRDQAVTAGCPSRSGGGEGLRGRGGRGGKGKMKRKNRFSGCLWKILGTTKDQTLQTQERKTHAPRPFPSPETAPRSQCFQLFAAPDPICFLAVVQPRLEPRPGHNPLDIRVGSLTSNVCALGVSPDRSENPINDIFATS